ncbi:MAG: DUF4112 domain-containing protein [Hyphomicrobiaceae bacterium]
MIEDAEDQALRRLEALAKLMDSAFVVPGTDVRFGLDGVIGLVPGIGDVVAGLVSSYLIWEARRLGVSKWILGRMMANTLLDTTIGAIPLAGDIFDVMFRANIKNMALLRRHLERKGASSVAATVIEGDFHRVN